MDAADFSVRDATSTDAPAIADLLAELGHPTAAVDIPARLAALVLEGGAVMLAVADQGGVLGMMSLARVTTLHAAGPVAYITSLVTTSDARRRGVGKAFIHAATQWATRYGCERLTVTSAEHRADAHRFYPACGLEYTGRRFSRTIGR
ncbi:MAG: GNAT family N-acetyltransferase [Gemmatimonadaceae bacterium]